MLKDSGVRWVVLGALVLVSVPLTAALANGGEGETCCKAGAPCCHPGSPCCAGNHRHGPDSDAAR